MRLYPIERHIWIERWGTHVDWRLAAAVLGLLALGTSAVLSSASSLPFYNQVMSRHFLALGIGFLAFLFGLLVDYQFYAEMRWPIFILSAGLLLAVLFFGQALRGSRAWLNLGWIYFQPAEAVRILTVLLLSSYLQQQIRRNRRIAISLGFWGYLLPLVGLILLQPDFSSTLPFFFMATVLLYCAGMELYPLFMLTGFGAMALAFPLFWTFLEIRVAQLRPQPIVDFLLQVRELGGATFLCIGGVFLVTAASAWILRPFRTPVTMGRAILVSTVFALSLLAGIGADHAMKGYQKRRFLAFVSPMADPLGAGYHLIQSQIAIGSGGFWGKGLFSGTQSHLGFLPERHTDFIFAVIGEELGFVGAMAVLGLYLFLIWRLLCISRISRDLFGTLFSCGMAALFGFYLFANTGMAMGMLPVAGLPLPLLSYGGSSMVCSLWGLGVVGSVYWRRVTLR
ncbi:MAG: rod shape-determining protein RodA [Elusimicrobia bacterium]|nr:rod shape-determining protein RodA [Elusimicrobiota bacterium]